MYLLFLSISINALYYAYDVHLSSNISHVTCTPYTIITQHLRERKLSSSSSDASSDLRASPEDSCASLNGKTFEFQTSWELDEDTAVSYPCSTGYLKNFAANPNLLEDLMDAVGPCFKYCNIKNDGYGSKDAVGSGDLSDLFDDDGKTCTAIDANAQSVDKVAGPTSCACASPADVSGCSMCSGTVTAEIVSCYNVTP